MIKKKNFDKILLETSIKDELAVLLDGKVGPEYSIEEFEEILKEGERRFKNKIPPGYKDSENLMMINMEIILFGKKHWIMLRKNLNQLS